MSLKSEILALDSMGATSRLKSTLSSLDESAQKIAPIVGMLRYQIAKTGGSVQDAIKGFPPESLAASTLRNCKVFENVFKEHVISGHITEESFMALSFGACNDLMAAQKIASTAAKLGGASNLAIQEKMVKALKDGKPAKDVLKSVKSTTAAKTNLASTAAKEAEKEAKLEADKLKREADKSAFDQWDKDGRPTMPDLSTAAKLAEFIMGEITSMKPKQRDAMPDMLRAIADRLETIKAESTPAENVVEFKKAA